MCATRLWIMASLLWVLSGNPSPSSKPNPDQAATWRCCQGGAGLVVDVGANFGWYTLYSLALGCRTLSFEPVPMWREVLRLGVALNRGFGARVRVVPRVVSNRKGVVTLAVPRPEAADFEGKGKLLLGMTGMVGPAGLVKGYSLDGPQAVRVEANSTRLDDELTGPDANVCMLKADVERASGLADSQETAATATRVGGAAGAHAPTRPIADASQHPHAQPVDREQFLDQASGHVPP